MTSSELYSSVSKIDEKLLDESLRRIFLSAEFIRSERMIALLRFLTEHAVRGNVQLLNERAIGREIFGRSEDWDPAIDTIVRSEARRLRSKLQIYYEGPGSTDALRISIPKGSYAPKIEQLVFTTVEAPAALPLPPPAITAFRSLRTTAMLTALIVLALGFFIWHTRSSSHSRFRIIPFTSDLGQEFSPSISPDGKWVLYAADAEGTGTRIYLKGIDAKEAQPLTPAGGMYLFPSWSPDGRSLAYLNVQADRVLVQTRPIAGGPELTITTIAKEIGRWSSQPSPLLGNSGPAWMPDGKHLIVSDHTVGHSNLVSVDEHGVRVPITTSSDESRDFYPRPSPDGKLIAFVRYYTHGSADIYVVPANGGELRQITFDQHSIQGIVWEKDSKSLIASSDRDGGFALWRIPLKGPYTRLPISALAAAEPSVSATTGAIAFVESTENWNIWQAPLASGSMGKAVQLLSSSGRNYDPRYSPDGQHIAFVSDRSGNMQIWIANANGSHAMQKTNMTGAWMGGISWSPDGNTIAFDARPQDHAAIYQLNVASGVVTALNGSSFEERMPAFSRDGRSLYFNSTRSGAVGIWKYDLNTHALTRLPSADAFSAQESFDGNKLIYSTRSGEIWVASPSTEPPQKWHGIVADPGMSWFVNNSGLFYSQRSPDGTFQLCHVAANTAGCFGALPGTLVLNAPDIAISPDGKSVLFARQDASTGDIKIALPVDGL